MKNKEPTSGTNSNVLGLILMACSLGLPGGISCLAGEANPTQEGKPPLSFTIHELQEKPVIDFDHPDAKDNKYGFEGGVVVKSGSAYHLFVSEMDREPLYHKTRLAYWTSPDAIRWKRVSTLINSEGNIAGPTPIFNEQENRWNLFYVLYKTPSNNGKIWRAVSEVAGRDGLAGPYKNAGIVMQQDEESQPWEGYQAVDSFFPYRVKDRWYAFYGSYAGKPKWDVGLAEAPELAGPWKRCPSGNPVPIEKTFIENPLVTRIGGLFVAIYDSGNGVGYSWSTDGIHWSSGARIKVQPDGPAKWSSYLRTPLSLIEEGNGIYTVIYTGGRDGRNFFSVGMVRVKLE